MVNRELAALKAGQDELLSGKVEATTGKPLHRKQKKKSAKQVRQKQRASLRRIKNNGLNEIQEEPAKPPQTAVDKNESGRRSRCKEKIKRNCVRRTFYL